MAQRGRKAGVTFAAGYSKARVMVKFAARALEDRAYYWRLAKAVGKQPTEQKIEGDKAVFFYDVRPSMAALIAARARTVSMKGAVAAKVLQAA